VEPRPLDNRIAQFRVHFLGGQGSRLGLGRWVYACRWASHRSGGLAPKKVDPFGVRRPVLTDGTLSPWCAGVQGAEPPAYRQNCHHGLACGGGDGAGSAVLARSWCSSLICLSFSWIWPWSMVTSCRMSLAGPSSSCPLAGWGAFTLTIHLNPCAVCCFSPVSIPLDSRRLTVWILMWRCAAASEMVICMVSRVSGRLTRWVLAGYAVLTRFDGVAVW